MLLKLIQFLFLILAIGLIQFGILAKHTGAIKEFFLPITIFIVFLLFIGIPLIALIWKPKKNRKSK